MQLVEWLARQVGGVRLGGDLRTRVAAICFGVAQEHHAAIVTLLALVTPLSSSAFALGRPQFEAYVRGMWLAHCATDEQVEGYLQGKVPDMASLIAAIEKLQGDGEVSSLRTIYRRSWRAMSGMTHTGAEHFERWGDGEVLEPAFTYDDIGRILDFAARIGVLSTAGIALLSHDADLWRRLLAESRALMPPRFDAPAE
jgi:hypothetical protein